MELENCNLYGSDLTPFALLNLSKTLGSHVKSGSNVHTLCTEESSQRIRCTIMRATVFYQQIENGNIANQIHRFTIGYGKFILITNYTTSPSFLRADSQ